uniref:Transmembrane protein 69-like n=1 Tax=Crassostrea virginica TaxID=6565 RepID=A0A8B8CFI8_CRAVI|nr:transmembrane protein 69-like [Crassostrea virginica]XP_022314559.1 transmembrane protein 69-like [Crassostrea virginica]XP_022314560.1 transmembrane protein 69-like [Crassostrea virginica]
MASLCRFASANKMACFQNTRNCYALLGVVSNSNSLQNNIPRQQKMASVDCTVQSRRGFRSLISNMSNKLTNMTSGFRTGNTGLVIDGILGLRHCPYPALVLGASGLLPFIGAPGLMMILGQSSVAFLANAQMVYGACILSFLGGVRWGFGVCEGKTTPVEWDNMKNMTISIVPSLVAFTAVLCPEPVSQIIVMLGLTGVGCYDAVSESYPAWFRGLRMLLTFVAVSSFILTFSCKSRLKSTDSSKDSKPTKETEKPQETINES